MISNQQLKRKNEKHQIDDLGFESEAKFINALRVKLSLWESVINSENDYPYEAWKEPKKNGGFRLIEHPNVELKFVQRQINRILQRLNLPKMFHGCFRETSIITNAFAHKHNSWFYTFDLANYYKTIRPAKVYNSLRSLKAAPDVARLITRLTTIQGHVPQGAPTSPIIAAIAMLSMAARIQTLCKKLNAYVTIYGDNVCISGPKSILRHRNTFLQIAITEGFKIRKDKTLCLCPIDDKVLPGLIVRKGKITIADNDLSKISELISLCIKLGKRGLSTRVCNRFQSRINGIVNHYKWIDKKRMRNILKEYTEITWPAKYKKEPCQGLKCFCQPSLGLAMPDLK